MSRSLSDQAPADPSRPADHIDPAYGRALRDALAAGVEVLALGATVTPQAIALTRRLAVTVP